MNSIGHNRATPFDLAQESVETLRIEAGNWLDGAAVETQEQADALAKLLDMARQTRKGVDEARVLEKKPHDDAAKAVQARFKPLLESCDRVAVSLKEAIAPWLERLEAERRAEAERLRKEAEAKAAAAQAAIEDNRAADLTHAEARDAAIEEAKRAEAVAKKAAGAKAHAKGGGRAIGLRTRKVAEVTDAREAARHFWKECPDRFNELLQKLAQEQINAGRTNIPGVTVREERSAA